MVRIERLAIRLTPFDRTSDDGLTLPGAGFFVKCVIHTSESAYRGFHYCLLSAHDYGLIALRQSAWERCTASRLSQFIRRQRTPLS